MKRLRISAVLLAILAAGCERATAPQVRDSIEVAQHRLLSGNLGAIGPEITNLIERVRGPYPGLNRFPSNSVIVTRGGDRHLMTATVFERVYLPPRGSGGLPFDNVDWTLTKIGLLNISGLRPRRARSDRHGGELPQPSRRLPGGIGGGEFRDAAGTRSVRMLRHGIA